MRRKGKPKQTTKKLMRAKHKQKDAQPNIAKITRGLLVDIRGLHLALAEISKSLAAQVKKDAGAFVKFGEKHGLTSKGRGSKELSIPVQEIGEFRGDRK